MVLMLTLQMFYLPGSSLQSSLLSVFKKKNVSSGDQTQVLGIARPALLLSSLASSWSLVFTLRMVLNTTQ